MINGLTGIGPDVGHDAVPLGKRLILCYGRHDLEHLRQERAVFPGQLGRRGDVLFGYHQYMHGGVGIDVPECQHSLSLVNNVGVYLVRRYLAEQTVLCHSPPLTV